MTEWILTSSVLILIVIALRWVLKGKISLRLQYGLWALVLVRLLLPFSISGSAISIGNLLREISSQSVVQEAGAALENYENTYREIQTNYAQQGISVTPAQVRQEAQTQIYNDTYEELRASHSGEEIPASRIKLEAQQRVEAISFAAMFMEALPHIWYTGMILVAVVLGIANLRFGWKLRRNRKPLSIPGVPLEVYHTPCVETPCLFGFPRPAIYLTDEELTDSRMQPHVLAHEMSHFRQGDHFWSVLRCVCLVLHWYNPLVWAAAILSKRDAELACDEATIAALGEEHRAEYGRTLIGMTCVRRDPRNLLLTATTMLGSKKTLKERITLIARKPETALHTLVACILVGVIAVGCTFAGASETVVTPIDWELYGTWLTADGEPGEKIEFQVKGEIRDHIEEYDQIDLVFTFPFPEYFRYSFGGSEDADISMTDQYDELDYFVIYTLCYDAQTDRPVSGYYAVSINEGYMIFKWKEENIYLVASTNPDTDPAEIFQYFQRFVDVYAVHKEPEPTEAATEPPTEPVTETVDPMAEDLAYFQELLTPNNYWYWRIMSCTFADPKDISLEYMFYTGLALEDRQDWSEYTDEEAAFLQDWLADTYWDEESWKNAEKMPMIQIDLALREYLGVSLDDMDIPEDWMYYAETDAFYSVHTDAFGVAGTNVTAVDRGEHGLIRVYWTVSWMYNTSTGAYMEQPLMVMTLQEKESGGYYILSNVPVDTEVIPN